MKQGKLVLTRHAGESIVLDDHTIITIEQIRGNRVSVSISAPKSVGITRGELVKSINKTVTPKLMEGHRHGKQV